MNDMNDCLVKMKALIKKDLESRKSKKSNINLASCTTVNSNIQAYFNVGCFATELWLYKVIYFAQFNKFLLFVYRLKDDYAVDEYAVDE